MKKVVFRLFFKGIPLCFMTAGKRAVGYIFIVNLDHRCVNKNTLNTPLLMCQLITQEGMARATALLLVTISNEMF